MAKVLVTGATGFVGRAVCERLLADGHEVVGALRGRPEGLLPAGMRSATVGDLGPETRWAEALQGVEVVFHLAARVHQMTDRASDPLAEYRRVNTLATQGLAEASAGAGVRRLVFVSSIKVNGEGRDAPYTEDDVAQAADPYGISKREAEEALRGIATRTGLEVVIVRPPLVYGPGVKANMLRMFEAIDRGVPLPLGQIPNRRSLVYVGNLADALVTCAAHPRAANRTYLVSDGRDVSTTELARMIAGALGRPARLVPVPPALIRMAAGVLGRGGAAKRLLGSLTVDIGRIRAELNWRPPVTTEEGLRRTAAWFRGRRAAQP